MLELEVKLARGNMTLDACIHDEGCICLCGTNGSGKTTLLNVVAGNLAPNSGYVKVNSEDVTRLPQEKRGVVLVNPDSLIPHLEVEKHLRWGAAAKKIELPEEEVAEVKKRLGIAYSGRVDKLSLGMRERVSLATALLSAPKVILVDEAFANIDHREEFVAAYRELCRSRHIDLVFTTQLQADAGLADHHYDIDEGKSSRRS